jgi:hypothetical protein
MMIRSLAITPADAKAMAKSAQEQHEAMTATPMTTEREDEAGREPKYTPTQIVAARSICKGREHPYCAEFCTVECKATVDDLECNGSLRDAVSALRSPAPTGAGEAEVVDGVLTIKAAAQVQNLLADHLRIENGEIMGVGPASYAVARALRRAQPPQQTGGIDAEQLATHVERSKPAIARLRATLESRQQPTGDVEGLGLTMKELCELLGKHAGCFMPCACHEVGPPHGAGGQGPCRALANTILDRVNSRLVASAIVDDAELPIGGQSDAYRNDKSLARAIAAEARVAELEVKNENMRRRGEQREEQLSAWQRKYEDLLMEYGPLSTVAGEEK